MFRRRSLSNKVRNRALGMWQSGLACRNVACTFWGSPSTISRLFNRVNAANSMCGSTRSGYPRMTTQRQDSFIRNLSLRNRTLNVRTLTHELWIAAGVNIRDQTIRSRLRTRNLKQRRSVVHIPLTRHRCERLDWCRCHLRGTARQWSTVSKHLSNYKLNSWQNMYLFIVA